MQVDAKSGWSMAHRIVNHTAPSLARKSRSLGRMVGAICDKAYRIRYYDNDLGTSISFQTARKGPRTTVVI